MFSGETVELLKKISDSHLEMTNKFLNASLDNLNKTNSTLFKPELIDDLKDDKGEPAGTRVELLLPIE